MSPTQTAAWQQAEANLSQGRQAEAEDGYRRIAETGGEFEPVARLRLSLMADRSGRLREATTQALAAMQSASGDAGLLGMIGKRLLTLGETRSAIDCAEAMLRQTRPDAGDCAELGKLMSDHMQVGPALALLGRAVELGLGDSAAVRYLLGLNHLYRGELDQAQAQTERALALAPYFHLAYWTLAKIGAQAGRPERIRALRARLDAVPEGHPDYPLLAYSLFHELDASDETEMAWPVLELAMRARRAQLVHDPDGDDRLHAALADRWASMAKAWPVADGHVEGPQPIFVVGMPRTGTTVMEQALCDASDASSAGELRDLMVQMRWAADLSGPWAVDEALLARLDDPMVREAGARYLEHTRWRAAGAAHYTDKWPGNYQAVGQVRLALPHARIVVVHRDPMDACFSNLKEWFGGAYAYSYDQVETARHYARYDRLMNGFRELAPLLTVPVRYEAFVESPTEVMDGIVSALGLPAPVGGRMTDGTVATASSVQVREGVHRRGVGAWRRYERQLEPLRNQLETLGHDTGATAA